MPSASSSSSSKRLESKSSLSPSSSKRKRDGEMTAMERRVYQIIFSSEGHSMSSPDFSETFSDMSEQERSDTINALARKSLLIFQKRSVGDLLFVAVSKKEASLMGQLEDDEAIVYAHIRDSRNDGIWTKILKSKCNMHQTVITRSLKSLESKSLIKAVKSVKNPTRKIYMLKELQPSVELSGGPWYTDHELDTAFIEQLCHMLDIFICQETWPESKGQRKRPTAPQPVLLSNSASYLPNATACLRWLMSKKVTDTKLQVQDVQSLLNVLIYEGKIEKIPQFGITSKRSSRSRKSSRRSRSSDDEYDDRGHRDGYESVSDESEVEVSRRRKKGRSRASSESDSESDARSSHDKRKTSHSLHSGKSRGSKKARKRSRDKSDSESEASSSTGSKRDRKRKSIRIDSEDSASDESDDDDIDAEQVNDNFVYRAIRPLQTNTGWTEVPCSHCPVMNFCQQGGPINAESCIYMRDWLARTKKRDEEDREAASAQKSAAGKISLAEDYDGALVSAGEADAYYDQDTYAPESTNGMDEYEEDYGGEEV